VRPPRGGPDISPNRKALAYLAALSGLWLVGCGPRVGDRVGGLDEDPRNASWLAGSPTITPEHLSRALALGARDREVTALVNEAVQRLAGGDPDRLASAFSPCPPGVTTEGGLTLLRSHDAYLPRTIEELAFGTRHPRTAEDLAELQKGPLRDVRVVDQPDFLVVERTLVPQICIVGRLSLASAYEAIVHELVHAVRNNPRDGSALAAKIDDEAAFRAALVAVRGGELEAYVVGTRARLRLGQRGVYLSPIIHLFDPRTGELAAPYPVLVDLILAPRPRGLGYADGLMRDSFLRARAELAEHHLRRRTIVERVLEERRGNIGVVLKNIDVHTHNLAAHRHNLELATARGSRALTETSRAGIKNAEEKLARSRAMLDAARASEVRLRDELEAIRAEERRLSPAASAADNDTDRRRVTTR
jgi:hypothetical protein